MFINTFNGCVMFVFGHIRGSFILYSWFPFCVQGPIPGATWERESNMSHGQENIAFIYV